jgi:8-oxo-dGTP pyrophosphatase MutT (NUDIX family)
MRNAAVLLVIKDGLILAISRRHDRTKFGLLGGKCEPDEQPWLAAQREAKEEAGIYAQILCPIYKRVEPKEAPDGEDFFTYCFYAMHWSGEPQSSEEGEVKWLTEKEITETMAAFPDYNIATLKAFKEKFPDVFIKAD